jgi:pimeloyl-ACP methyl ester carboxylesterase
MEGKLLSSGDGSISGMLMSCAEARPGLPLLACIHGGGCNGNYFDLKGCSTVQVALASGFPVLLINRPGYAGNRALDVASPIAEGAASIGEFIERVRGTHVPDADGVAIIGHSIGGAVALTIAAASRNWHLRGIAVSGIGISSPDHIRAIKVPPDEVRIEPPAELTEFLFHDPDRALNWRAVASLRAAAEPWLVSELLEVVQRWPANFFSLAPRIDVPVHIRLAEHEKIWETGLAQVNAMASALTRARRVDAALLPIGGHLFEAYRPGPQLVQSQLDFLQSGG